MNVDRFLAALGATAGSDAALPLVMVDGRPVTISRRWSTDAVETAGRRATPLVVATDDGRPPRPTAGSGRTGPVVAVGSSPWAIRSADLGLLVGACGPADHDGLDEAGAAGLTRRFLELSVDGDAVPPTGGRSLLEVVPFPVEEPYDIDAVLETVVDGGGWLELDAGGAGEVLTAVARIGGRSVGIAASRANVMEGRLSAAGCARVERLVRWCSRRRRPFVSLVDTAGLLALPDIDHAAVVARAAAAVREADPLKCAVVIGRAVGLAATVMGAVGARADVVLPWPRARFALALPEAGTAEVAELAELSAVGRAARAGDVVDVIHPDHTRQAVLEMLDLLRGQRCYADA